MADFTIHGGGAPLIPEDLPPVSPQAKDSQPVGEKDPLVALFKETAVTSASSPKAFSATHLESGSSVDLVAQQTALQQQKVKAEQSRRHSIQNLSTERQKPVDVTLNKIYQNMLADRQAQDALLAQWAR
jgi:hypothetical protein